LRPDINEMRAAIENPPLTDPARKPGFPGHSDQSWRLCTFSQSGSRSKSLILRLAIFRRSSQIQ
jgi:hypothetical protein